MADRITAKQLRATIPLEQRTWLSTIECATYLGFGESHLHTLLRDHRGPPSTLISARARRFKRADVDAWVEARGVSQ